MRKLGILFLAMTMLLFAACTSDAKQPTVPATPIPTVTSTPVPTATLAPTDTPVPTATPTPTSTPTPTPEIIPTYDEVMAKWNAQKVPMTMKMPLTITFSENIEGASFSVSISADMLARVNDNVSYTKMTMDYMGISFDTEAYIVQLEDGTTLNYSQYDDGEWFYVTSEGSTEFASDYESFFSSKIAGEVERTETGYKVTVSANELMDSLLELLGESMGHSDFVITYYADKDLNLLNGTGKLEYSMDMDEGSMSISLSTEICVDENPLELPKEVKAAKEYSEWHGMNTNPLFGTLNGVPFQAGMSADYFGKDDWEPYEFYYGSPFVNEKYGSEKDYDLLYLFCARGAHYRTEIGSFDDLDKYGVFGYCYEPVSDPDAVHPDFVWGNNVRIGASTADLEKEYGHPYEEYCDEDENGIYGEYTYYIVEEDYTYRMIFYFTNDKLIGVRLNSYCMHVDDGSCSICSNLEKEAADMEKAYGHYIRMCEACDEYIGYGLEFPESITSSFSIVQFSHGLQLRNEDLLVEYADSYVKKGDKAGILDYFYGFGVRKPQHGTINDREVLFGISDPDPDTGETKIYVLTETNETCEHYLETHIIVYADGYDPIQLIETLMAFI